MSGTATGQVKFKQTETPPAAGIPEGWEESVFGDMAELIKDGYKPTGNDNFAYIGLEHINQQSLSLNSIGHSTEVGSNKFAFQSGDILFGKLRPYFRKVYRPRFEGVCSTDIWVVRAKGGIDQGYLFYLMASQEFVDLASSGSSGTRMPRADLDHLKNTVWPTPPIVEQRAIAKILSDLDAKIELNRRMNETLEQIARAIFKRWFVDFEFPGHEKTKFVDGLPEGWRVGQFGELARIQPGFAFKSQDFTANGYKIIKIRNIQNGVVDVAQTDYVSEDIYHSVDQKFHLVSGDAIIAMTGAEIGKIGIIPKTDDVMLLNQRVGKLVSDYFLWAYFMLNGSEIQSLIQGISSASSAQPNISNSDIEKTNVIIPAAGILEQFSQIGHSLYEKTIENLAENQTISQIRDTLLPKLMSGEVRI